MLNPEIAAFGSRIRPGIAHIRHGNIPREVQPVSTRLKEEEDQNFSDDSIFGPISSVLVFGATIWVASTLLPVVLAWLFGAVSILSLNAAGYASANISIFVYLAKLVTGISAILFYSWALTKHPTPALWVMVIVGFAALSLLLLETPPYWLDPELPPLAMAIIFGGDAVQRLRRSIRVSRASQAHLTKHPQKVNR